MELLDSKDPKDPLDELDLRDRLDFKDHKAWVELVSSDSEELPDFKDRLQTRVQQE